MFDQFNPYSAPQSSLNATKYSAPPTTPNETRWYYADYGYRLSFFASGILLMHIFLDSGELFPWNWMLLSITYLVVIWPSFTLLGLLLGAVAALIDRWLQDRGWREPYCARELDR
jgi:NhaP-type Na+/H+ or K+/H+ antiporter